MSLAATHTGDCLGVVTDTAAFTISAPSRVQAARAGQTFSAMVRITSADANSGASTVALSNDPGMSEAVTYTVQGGASIDVVWPITGSPYQVPVVYARADDRAGNESGVAEQPLMHRVWLLMVRHDAQ